MRLNIVPKLLALRHNMAFSLISENLTKTDVLCLVSYDPLTGDFVWRERPLAMFDNLRRQCIWNARYAGKEAGHVTRIGYRCITIHNVHARRTRLNAATTAGLLDFAAIATTEWPSVNSGDVSGITTTRPLTGQTDILKKLNELRELTGDAS
jgi:hypothetical protein